MIVDPAQHAQVSETRFDWDGSNMMPVTLRIALCDWLLQHDIEPADVPVAECYIERRVGARQVGYRAFSQNESGHRIVDGDTALTEDRYQQLEAPPLPWPDAVTRLSEGEA